MRTPQDGVEPVRDVIGPERNDGRPERDACGLSGEGAIPAQEGADSLQGYGRPLSDDEASDR